MTKDHGKIAAAARFARWLAPSLAFAVWGALAAAIVETMTVLGDPLTAVAAAGFLALIWVPLALLASVVVRGLWRW
ncbi:MAG TPA: hypothetical protein VFG83_02360, partial [Kofleriaceae bacterium]|nr:hypothetical protein [Kofleriaceae bacterium]